MSRKFWLPFPFLFSLLMFCSCLSDHDRHHLTGEKIPLKPFVVIIGKVQRPLEEGDRSLLVEIEVQNKSYLDNALDLKRFQITDGDTVSPCQLPGEIPDGLLILQKGEVKKVDLIFPLLNSSTTKRLDLILDETEDHGVKQRTLVRIE